VSASLTIAGSTLSLSGWFVPAALLVAGWVGELAAQGWAIRRDG
jgi:hypothetical protein